MQSQQGKQDITEDRRKKNQTEITASWLYSVMLEKMHSVNQVFCIQMGPM